MAILKICDSFCNDRIGVKCFDLLFDKYGAPVTITTGEDIMNHVSRLKFTIPGIQDNDEVDIRFTERADKTVEMSEPVIISRGDDYSPVYLSCK